MIKKPEIIFAPESKRDGLEPRVGRVTFGNVTVNSVKPNAEVVAQNVTDGQSALRRAAEKLSRPGVTLRSSKSVPLYYVDDARPKEIVRELDGEKVFGVFRDGKFVASNG